MTLLNLYIYPDNLIYNLSEISRRTEASICAVVKANAYGHGVEIAKFIDGYVDAYAVSCPKEVFDLRKYTDKKIYVLSPCDDLDENNIIYSVSSIKDLHHDTVCVKINSGMNRIGIIPALFPQIEKICEDRKIKIDSLYTHFLSVEQASEQFDKFMSIEGNYMRHCCASNCLCLSKSFHLDMVRCGIAVYGYGDPWLRPALKAFASVIQVLSVRKGEHVGYGNYVAECDMKIAVLSAGYADGIRRCEQYFWIRGRECKTVGAICMDVCMVDVSMVDCLVGDEAEFIGSHISGEEVALRSNTIVYDVLTSFSGRSNRIYEKRT